MSDPRLACGLNATDQVRSRRALIKELQDAIQETRELPIGYVLRFPGDERWCQQLVDFIAFERACCPFLSFELKFAAFGGPIWLQVVGPPGAKDFIRREAVSARTQTDDQSTQPGAAR
jgi:hypothetical protein